MDDKYASLFNTTRNNVMTETMLRKYIAKLRLGCGPGIDELMAEHLKHAIGTSVISHLSLMFRLCIRFGVVPSSLGKSILISLLKKPTLDPSIPCHYRPVTISSALSKLLELYTLDVVGLHEFSGLQLGFIPDRGTQIAVFLVNDVISLCTYRLYCSLDAEGAFDAIPHPLLFHKAINTVPDQCWRILVY